MLEKFKGEKRKQLLFLGGSILLVAGAVFLLSEMMGQQPKQEQKPPPPKVQIEEKKIQDQSIKAEFGEQILLLQKQIEELKKQQEEQQRQQQQQQALNQIFQPPPSPPPPPPPPPTTAYPPTPPPKEQEQKPAMPVDLIALEKKEQTEEEKEPKEEKQEEKKEEKVRKGSVIPAGAFVRGVLLSGLDAPTGGKAQTSPHPVLIRITDKAVLPNLYRSDIRECFVIGSGYGDLSAERAYIRLEAISCVKKGGEVVEKKVSGYVAGEDGKVGLLGRVVSKQGQILARMLVAGFIEGVAKLFQQAGTTVVVSPVGGGATTTSIDPNQVVRTGIAGGFSEASRLLVEQYKKLADETFPVIEINAGRSVDLVFLQSFSLEDIGGEQVIKPEHGLNKPYDPSAPIK